MADFPVATIIVLIVVIYLAYTSLRIAGENERFAKFVLGRFEGFVGPGLIFVPPSIVKLIRVKLGDVGTVTSSQFVRFGDTEVPVSAASSFNPGDAVRVDGFGVEGPVLSQSNVRATQICPKCGHSF